VGDHGREIFSLGGTTVENFSPVQLDLPVRPPVEINLNRKTPQFSTERPYAAPPWMKSVTFHDEVYG